MENTSKYCTLYVVRHGESEANLNEIVRGQTEAPLTVNGENQAKKRGKDFENIKFDAIFSSDIGRAFKTAEFIKLDRKLAIMTHKLLRERNFGPFEGKSIEHYLEVNKKLFDDLKTMEEKEKLAFKPHPDHESNDEIAMRMLTFLREIAVTYLGQKVLVVSHGSIMRATLMHLGFATYDELPSKTIENTAYFVLESDGVDFFVKETVGINKLKI